MLTRDARAVCVVFTAPAGTPSRGAQMLGRTRHFDCHFILCYTQVIMPASTDASRWLAADARAEGAGARPGRAVMARRLRRLIPTPTLVWFLDGIKRVRGFLW